MQYQQQQTRSKATAPQQQCPAPEQRRSVKVCFPDNLCVSFLPLCMHDCVTLVVSNLSMMTVLCVHRGTVRMPLQAMSSCVQAISESWEHVVTSVLGTDWRSKFASGAVAVFAALTAVACALSRSDAIALILTGAQLCLQQMRLTIFGCVVQGVILYMTNALSSCATKCNDSGQTSTCNL
jgi:hypothetical protein